MVCFSSFFFFFLIFIFYFIFLTDLNSFLLLILVQSFGTEDRVTDNPVASQNCVYGFISFSGQDIKTLDVCEEAPSMGVCFIEGLFHFFINFFILF